MPTYGWGANEPEIKPVAQGGDTIAGYATKVKNAISNLFDTLNTFPWSNATQSSAGFMSSDDKKAVDGIADLGTFNKMFFSQTSGSYVSPRTGVYRITLKGGGGGGGGLSANNTNLGSSGGGEGGTLSFYTTLIKNTSYAYTIGAGGAAGTSGNSGQTGGSTTFNSVYSVNGGGGGTCADATYARGGDGGRTFSAPAGQTVFFTPGALGQAGVIAETGITPIASGGGAGGGRTGGGSNAWDGVYGGGGSGPIKTAPATAGGDGYILIEYAG